MEGGKKEVCMEDGREDKGWMNGRKDDARKDTGSGREGRMK